MAQSLCSSSSYQVEADSGWTFYPEETAQQISQMAQGDVISYSFGRHSYTIQRNPDGITQRNIRTRKVRSVRRAPTYSVQGDEEGEWHLYPIEVSSQISNLSDGQSMNFSQGGYNYVIANTGSGVTQTNTSTNRVRTVRPVAILDDEKSSDEAEVRRRFYENMDSSKWHIVSIDHVSLPALERRYMSSILAMQTALGRPDVERTLFHGTSDANASSIAREGFKCAQNKRAAYGRGTYFGSHSNTSHGYTKPNSASERKMIFARVLVGDSVQGSSSYQQPPMKPDSSTRYESMVNNVSSPTIFSIYEDGYCLPQYIITYVAKHKAK